MQSPAWTELDPLKRRRSPIESKEGGPHAKSFWLWRVVALTEASFAMNLAHAVNARTFWREQLFCQFEWPLA
jgi:hypothetical protein